MAMLNATCVVDEVRYMDKFAQNTRLRAILCDSDFPLDESMPPNNEAFGVPALLHNSMLFPRPACALTRLSSKCLPVTPLMQD
jgi:hypothetical protein